MSCLSKWDYPYTPLLPILGNRCCGWSQDLHFVPRCSAHNCCRYFRNHRFFRRFNRNFLLLNRLRCFRQLQPVISGRGRIIRFDRWWFLMVSTRFLDCCWSSFWSCCLRSFFWFFFGFLFGLGSSFSLCSRLTLSRGFLRGIGVGKLWKIRVELFKSLIIYILI